MKILLIEDEKQITDFIKKGLESESHVVETARTGEVGVALATECVFDILILDYHLPDMKGHEVAVAIRKRKPSIPILVLSAEKNMDIKIDMLSICDDYLTKPFSLRELIVRLRTITRRGEILHNDILKVGALSLDSRRHMVVLEGRNITLRNKEFALLEYFMKNEGVVLSREMILENVWDMNADPFTNTVDTHVRLIRKKLDSKKYTFIRTIPRRGYRFEASK